MRLRLLFLRIHHDTNLETEPFIIYVVFNIRVRVYSDRTRWRQYDGVKHDALVLDHILVNRSTVEPLLRGHPDHRPPPLERPFDNVYLTINVLISNPNERPPLLKGHFSDAKGVALQEGFHRIHTCALLCVITFKQ